MVNKLSYTSSEIHKPSNTMNNKKRILFVCMGNICRSPAAEAIMKSKLNEVHLDDQFEVDSAGSIDYHVGEPADERMIMHASKRGYKIDSIARHFNSDKDFSEFDYIVTMDEEIYSDIRTLDLQNKFVNKIFRMTEFCEILNAENIPDPYYNDASGFEEVLDLLEDSTNGLLKKIIDDIRKQNKNNN